MTRRPPLLLTRNRLLACIGINQLATPGLGSLMARRYISGAAQLLLALAGFALIVVWMFQLFYRLTLRELDQPAPQSPNDRMWTWGLILFGASWLWALVTSISLFRLIKAAERLGPAANPPRIAEHSRPKPGASP